MRVTEAGISTDNKDEQPVKVPSSMLTERGISTLVSDVQPAKVPFNWRNDCERVTSVRLVQP